MIRIDKDDKPMKNMMILTVLLLMITTGCTSSQGGGGELPVPSTWELLSFGKTGAETPVIQSSNVMIEFEQNGQVGGSGGCNAYGATYEIQGDTISFKEIISTLMACADGQINQQEQQYFKALQAANEYKISGDNLSISYDQGQNVLNFIKQ